LDKGAPESLKPLELVRNVAADAKEAIISKPDVKINDLFKTNVVIENTNVVKPQLPRRIATPTNVTYSSEPPLKS